MLIAGSNMAFAHPVLFRRLEEARARRPDMRVIVVDPRRTDTCELADLHLAITPGSDVALFHGILHILLWEGWVDRRFIERHTEGFDALRSACATSARRGWRSYAESMPPICCAAPSGSAARRASSRSGAWA